MSSFVGAHWSHELSGELRLARHSEAVADFDRGAICLSRVRAETFCGFVFVNLDPDVRPIMEEREGLDREIRELSPDIENLKVARTLPGVLKGAGIQHAGSHSAQAGHTARSPAWEEVTANR